MFYKIINFLKGKKTFIVGIAAVIYGVYAKDPHTIVIGLGLIGIRDAMSTEIAKIITGTI